MFFRRKNRKAQVQSELRDAASQPTAPATATRTGTEAPPPKIAAPAGRDEDMNCLLAMASGLAEQLGIQLIP